MGNILLTNIKRIRKEKGFRVKDIAHKMGMAPESLSRSLHGNPTMSTVSLLADAIGVPMSDLFLTDKTISDIMNAYKVNSDIINDPDVVIANDANEAIEKYCKKYEGRYMKPEHVTNVERIAEKVLV